MVCGPLEKEALKTDKIAPRGTADVIKGEVQSVEPALLVRGSTQQGDQKVGNPRRCRSQLIQ